MKRLLNYVTYVCHFDFVLGKLLILPVFPEPKMHAVCHHSALVKRIPELPLSRSTVIAVLAVHMVCLFSRLREDGQRPFPEMRISVHIHQFVCVHINSDRSELGAQQNREPRHNHNVDEPDGNDQRFHPNKIKKRSVKRKCMRNRYVHE